jgi:hypothetical protein
MYTHSQHTEELLKRCEEIQAEGRSRARKQTLKEVGQILVVVVFLGLLDAIASYVSPELALSASIILVGYAASVF